MSAWETAPNVFCSTHADPTAIPAALQHSKLTEAITSKFSMCIYKAHSLLSTAQPQRVWRGIIYITPTGADLTYTGGGAVCGADSAWRTWRLTPSPTPGQASSLANKSQDRYGWSKVRKPCFWAESRGNKEILPALKPALHRQRNLKRAST